MNRIYHPARVIQLFFIKHYDAIKLGLLVGLLVSNVVLISRQAQTIEEVLSVGEKIENQIKEDNAARRESREDNKNRDLETRQFICRLIRELLTNAPNKPALESCDSVGVSETSTKPTEQKTAPVAEKKLTAQSNVRQNPTTSEPPDETTLGDVVKEVPTAASNLLKGLTDLIGEL